MTQESKKQKAIDLKKGIYLLPSIFTLGSIFFSFLAINRILHFIQNPEKIALIEFAALFILVAVFFDILDGKLARFFGADSHFGMELDSIADAISFGVAPAILAYVWCLKSLGRLGWLASFCYLICGVVRLARFNVLSDIVDKRFFIGFPIPAGATLITSLVLLFPSVDENSFIPLIILMIVFFISFMMVSKVRYRTFKEIDIRERKPFATLIILAVILIIFYLHWKLMLFIMAAGYLISGLVARYLPESWDWKRVGIDADHLQQAFGLDELDAEENSEKEEK